MPDWVHPLVVIAVWVGITWWFSVWLEPPWGFVLGLIIGRTAGVSIVYLLPGFWGSGERSQAEDKEVPPKQTNAGKEK